MKACTNCGYEPEPDKEQMPVEANEDCPQCGGIGTLRDEARSLDEGAEKEE